jgi:hypothetical protein
MLNLFQTKRYNIYWKQIIILLLMSLILLLFTGCVGGLVERMTPIPLSGEGSFMLPTKLGKIETVISSSIKTSRSWSALKDYIQNEYKYKIHSFFKTPGLFNDSSDKAVSIRTELLSFVVNTSNIFQGLYKVTIRYQFIGEDGNIIYSEEITSHGNDDSFIGMNRSRISIQYAFSNNIALLSKSLRKKLPQAWNKYVQLQEEKKQIQTEIIRNRSPMNAKLRVGKFSATIRILPSEDSVSVKKIKLGHEVHAINILPSGWIQVAENGKPIGWLHRDSLEESGPVESVAKSVLPRGTTDITPPRIRVISHVTNNRRKIVENRSSVTIKGIELDDSPIAEVRINNKPTTLDAEGNFSGNVLLRIGKNEIIVSAMDIQGNIAKKTFGIERNFKEVVISRP